MSGTSSAVLIVLTICLALIVLSLIRAARDEPTLPWRCRILGSHKFTRMDAEYIQDYCFRCGFPRKGGWR